MAWPSTLSSFTDPQPTDTLNSPSHSSIESAQNTGLEEVQAFLGTLSSAAGTLIYDIRAAASDGGGHVQTANKGGTGQTAFTKGDLLVASSSSVLSKLAIGQNNAVLLADSTQTVGARWASTLTANIGGTGNTTFAKGDILVASSSSVLTRLTVGADGQYLTANSGQATGVQWIDGSSVTGTTPGGANLQLQYNAGGTFAGASTLTWNSNGSVLNAALITSSVFTGSKAVVTTAGSILTVSETTATEIGYLSGITSSVVSIKDTQTLQGKTLVTPSIVSFINMTHNHQNNAGGSVLAEAALSLADNTTNDVSVSRHGFAPKATSVAGAFLSSYGDYRAVSAAISYGNGVTTRAGDAASGSQTIAHGLSGTPTYVRIVARKQFGSGVGALSDGSYNGSATTSVSITFNGASSAAANSSTNIVEILDAAGTSQVATVAVDGTNITLTWVKAGSPNSSTINIMWEAEV